jgi:cytochrome c-type biogenesis protein
MARPVLPGILLASVVLTATVAGALLSGPSGGAVGSWLGAMSGSGGAGLGQVAGAAPFGLAYAAGMLAAVNPCGFVLLPAYLGRHLLADGGEPRGRYLLRSLGFGATVTAGFVVLFAVAGVALGALGAVAALVPWAGVLVGALLATAGALSLGGGPAPTLAAAEGLAGRLGPMAARPHVLGHAAYGVAYGLASLGCALPAFLGVVGGATTRGFLGAVVLFVLYGLGLGTVLSAASVAAAWLGIGVVARLGALRRLTPVLGGALLLLAGAYVTYYWLTAGGVLARLLGT